MRAHRRRTTGRGIAPGWHEFASDCGQLLDGWHNDGTAWGEWDESVRKRLSELQRETDAYLSAPPDAAGPDLGRLAEWLRTTAGHCRRTGSWLTPPLTADNGSEWADKLTQAADALPRRGRDAGEVERLRERVRLLEAAVKPFAVNAAKHVAELTDDNCECRLLGWYSPDELRALASLVPAPEVTHE